MAPLLLDSDVVFVDTGAYSSSPPQIDDVVVALHPYQRDLQLIKRVANVADDRVFLRSDNPSEGTDSRAFGTIPCQRILGRVTARIEV